MKIKTEYDEKIKGNFSAFDRMIFKGHISAFYKKGNMRYYLWEEKVLLREFGKYAESITEKIKANAKNITDRERRPYKYVSNSRESKEKHARRLMEEDKIEEGLICVLTAVEPCRSISVIWNKEKKDMEIAYRNRKCLYLYFYYNDKEFGFMHVRIQTWFPFEIQVYINGREYLSRKFKNKGINYTRYENTFIEIGDIKKAQKLSNNMTTRKWVKILDRFSLRLNPMLKRIREIFNSGYYWCLDQCEYATDIMFESREYLEKIYPDIVDHAIRSFNSEDVMIFLGRKKLNGNFNGEVISRLIRRPEGVCIKHRMKGNSIKMYNKYSNLRIETTINQPKEFKIYRSVIRKGCQVKAWVPMGKGVSNMYRYVQVSKAANMRYIKSITKVKDASKVKEELEEICNSVKKENSTYSGFNPVSKETINIFSAILNGRNIINGFRNKDIRSILYPIIRSEEKRKYCVKVTIILKKLRTFGLIKKIPASFRYIVTEKGYRVMTASVKLKKKEFPEQMLLIA